MTQLLTGNREWNRINVLRWMRVHGRGVADARQLAEMAALAFGVADMFRAFDAGEHWAYELAGAVVMEGSCAAA